MYKDFYWVTDETRQFMEKGYLDPGQTVEERAWEIAKHAEDILMRQAINTDKVGNNYTAKVVAALRDEDFETLCTYTVENSRRIFPKMKSN